MRDFLSVFFRLAYLALQNVTKDYVIFSYFRNFVTKSDQKPKTKNGMNETLVSIARLYLIEPLQFVSPQTQCTRACLALTLGTHLLYDWEAWKISWPFLSQNQLFSSNLLHHAKILSFFLWWKVERKKKSIVMAWNKQKPCQLCIHECSQKSIIKVDLQIHCCVIIWNSFYYWAVIWAFQGLICLQTAGYSFLTVWTCQLCNIKLYTHFHSSLDMFPKSAFFTM